MHELRQALYLIADEMRGMATRGRTFAGNIYETERAHRMMALAAQVAALAEGEPMAEVRALFEAEPWHRASPMLGVNAVVLDSEGRVLLIQRKDNEHWDRAELPRRQEIGIPRCSRTFAAYVWAVDSLSTPPAQLCHDGTGRAGSATRRA